MGSGSQWGMILGFGIGIGLAFMTGGTSLAFMGWLGTSAGFGAAMYGAAIGATIGGLAGGLISPTEFHGPDVQGPRLEELQLTGVSEGSGITRAFGDQMRIAGMMIAAGGLRETKHTTENPTMSGKSFVAGTPIKLASGQEIPIEDVRVGDLLTTAHHGWLSKLLGKDPQFRRKRVTSLQKGTATKAIKVCADFDNKDIKNVEFTCTPEHEVYGYKVDRKPHWFQAQGLKTGDALYTENGWVRVVSCDRFEINEPVYNLTVNDDHNYLANGALVHNGGGGGGKSTTTWYTYSCDLVVATCEGPIWGVSEMFMNGKTKYSKSIGYTNKVGDNVSSFTVYVRAEPIGTYSSGHVSWRYIANISAAGGDEPFKVWAAGMRITTSGSTDGNSGDWNGEDSRKIRNVDNTNYDYIEVEIGGSTSFTQYGEYPIYTYTHVFSGFDDTTTEHTNNNLVNSTPITFTSSGTKIYTATIAYSGKTANGIRVYIGDDGSFDLQIGNEIVGNDGGGIEHYHNTEPDSVLSQLNEDSPAYRGTAYVVFDDLELADFGNQLPQCNFRIDARPRETEIEGNTAEVTEYCTVGQVIDVLMIRSGRYKAEGVGGLFQTHDHFDSDQFQGDTTGIHDNRVRGYAVVGAKTTQSALSNLILRYDILISEAGGVLKFARRGQEGSGSVTEADLGAYTTPENSEQDPNFAISDQPDTGLPNEINISYADVNDDYQKASQKARRSLSGLPRVDTIDLPMSMLASEAQSVANRVLYQTWSQRQACAFKLPPSYITVDEADILTVTSGAEVYKVRVLEINRGVDYIHEVRGLITESEEAPYSGEGDDGDDDEPTIYYPPPMVTYAADAPALHPNGIETLGHYFWACTTEINQDYQGGSIFVSDNETVGYSEISNYPHEAMIVKVETAIADGPISFWDETTSIEIEVFSPVAGDAPSTTTDALVLSGGSNHLYIGGELIGFRYVTAVGGEPQKYTLTKLIRGRRGTDDFIATHINNEYGCIVSHESSSGVATLNYEQEHIGVPRYYKLVPNAGELTDNEALSIEGGVRRIKPFPVGRVNGWKDGGWYVEFMRCDRSFDAKTLFSIFATPNSDTEVEIYYCKVYGNISAEGDTLLRTITMEASENGSVITQTVFDDNGHTTAVPFVYYHSSDYLTDLIDVGQGGIAQASISVEIYKIGDTYGVTVKQKITNTRTH